MMISRLMNRLSNCQSTRQSKLWSGIMAVVTGIETQIIRQLLENRENGAMQLGAVQRKGWSADSNIWADRLIAVVAATVGLVILGSYLEELLWAAVAGATVFTLR
jgi:hypothetical protein